MLKLVGEYRGALVLGCVDGYGRRQTSYSSAHAAMDTEMRTRVMSNAVALATGIIT
jgi:hypothetical protein